MKHLTGLAQRPPLLAIALTLVVTPAVAHAQPSGECSTTISPGVGFSAGRSLAPALELSQAGTDGGPSGSVLVGGGFHLGGRLDVPIAGPWRGRVEISGANWPIERQRYGDDFQLIATETIGKVKVRELVALIGRQGGRRPCGYVLAGGGIYSLDLGRTRVRRPGVALTAGVEMPVTGRSAVQLDVQLHMIGGGTPDPPLTRYGALAPIISVGWSYRF